MHENAEISAMHIANPLKLVKERDPSLSRDMEVLEPSDLNREDLKAIASRCGPLISEIILSADDLQTICSSKVDDNAIELFILSHYSMDIELIDVIIKVMETPEIVCILKQYCDHFDQNEVYNVVHTEPKDWSNSQVQQANEISMAYKHMGTLRRTIDDGKSIRRSLQRHLVNLTYLESQ